MYNIDIKQKVNLRYTPEKCIIIFNTIFYLSTQIYFKLRFRNYVILKYPSEHILFCQDY